MSNSSLATYIDTGVRNYSNRTAPISRITIHHAAGNCSMAGFSSILRGGNAVSWNYAIDSNGKIGLFVDEKYRAWTSSSTANDNIAITIEVANNGGAPLWPISDAAYNALLNLCTDICKRNNIARLTYTGKLEGSNLTMHEWFANKVCPGPYLKAKFPEIASTVNARLGLNTTTGSSGLHLQDDQTSYDAAITGSLSRPEEYVNTDQINPFVITVDRNSPIVNYSLYSNVGVVGTMIEAGYLYDAVHIRQGRFNNPKFRDQVLQSLEATVPYGMYMIARAWTEEEAKEEIYQLSFLVREYTPILGVWLVLSLAKSTYLNNLIVDTYYNELIRLGLKNRIGFYVNRTQLNKITWSDYQNDWYLWLVDHVSTMIGVDELLTPEFFMLNQ